MKSGLFGRKMTVVKTIIGVVSICYGALHIYAQFGLQPQTAFLLSGKEYVEDDTIIIPEYIVSSSVYPVWNGFRFRLCSPTFSSPKTDEFSPAVFILSSCVFVTVPYVGHTISFTIPDAEISVMYEGTHRLVSRSPIYGSLLFKEYKNGRERIRSLFLEDSPLSAKVWTQDIRFYTERPGQSPIYAAAEIFSVAWESEEGSTALARRGSRLMINIKHIIGAAHNGSDNDESLFPISFSAELRMYNSHRHPSSREEVYIDGAKIFFKDFALSAYGRISPSDNKSMYPKAAVTVEIDNVHKALQSSLSAALLLPDQHRAYARGRRMAQYLLSALKTEKDASGYLRRFHILKKDGKPLTIGGVTMQRLTQLYKKARKQ